MRSSQGNILCVDDDRQSLAIRKLLLETLGFQVMTAESGREGLQALETHDIDLALLDYSMPEMDGGMVAREIKRLKPDLPVLILSALSELPDEAPRECIDGFICKGEPTSTLVKTISEMMAARAEAGQVVALTPDIPSIWPAGASLLERLTSSWWKSRRKRASEAA